MTFKKILCPVDFSDPSRAALLAAAALAQESGGSLTVAHFFEMPAVGFNVPRAELFTEFHDKVAGDVETTLATWRQTALLAGAPAVDVYEREGSPSQQIVRLARAGDYDLVALGTRGLTGLQRLLEGSVAEKVTRHAPCAVLVVRADAPGSP